MQNEFEEKRSNYYVLQMTIFLISCVFINIAFNRIVRAMGLPLFIDNVGNIIAGAAGGYLPGILVGYISNVINMTADPENGYYAMISAINAILGTFFANKGFFDKFHKALITIPVFAIISGGLSSLITYLMYGFGMGEGISAPFARKLLEAGTRISGYNWKR